jgi:ATP-dependent protease ClpP protease subunit
MSGTPKRTKRSATAPLPSGKLAKYRPDPERAIYLHGEIDEALAYRLTEKIVLFASKSREPITVYIDSPGGDIFLSSALLRLLKSTDQDEAGRCRVLTVVTNYAGSAAADFLVSGDYAIAYPESFVHFHGTRTLRKDFITVEHASGVASDLKESNKRSALALIKNTSRRFFFRYFSLRPSFASHREKNPELGSNQAVFFSMIGEKLSPWGDRVVEKARKRWGRYQAVSDYVSKSKTFRRVFEGKKGADDSEWNKKLEAEMLRVMVTFELKKNKRDDDWTFTKQGLSQLSNDFLLLHEYISHHGDFENLFAAWKDFLLSPEDEKELEGLGPQEAQQRINAKLAPEIVPLRLFLGALCHALQEEENPMMAIDAFWLGLIDEVIGEDLPTERKLFERNPNLPNQSASSTNI